MMKIGDLVRFANEQDGGPVHRVVSVMSDGMIEIHDFGGYFAPHLFVAADDIGDIPPDHLAADQEFRLQNDRDWKAKVDYQKARAESAEAQRDRLASRVERLRGALEPFARADEEIFNEWCPDETPGWYDVDETGDHIPSFVTVGDFRTARAAYEETEDGE